MPRISRTCLRYWESKDFSFFEEAIPGYFFFLGMKNETKGHLEQRHSPNYIVIDDLLPYGATLHSSLATRCPMEYQKQIPTWPKKSVHDEL